MIQCGECGFPVNDTMRFALMQNSCPSCGSALFSNKDSHLIDIIQGKITSETFAQNFNEVTVYDVSLFIFNELKYGIGKQLRDELGAVTVSYEEDPNESEDEARIRKEVEAELAEEMVHLTDEGDVQGEEIFSKADRLKRLHEQKIKSNPKITRGSINSGIKRGGGGFKGVSRTD